MRNLPFLMLLVLALGLGAGILLIDSRPAWDATGITVGFIFVSAAALGFANPSRAWLFALAISAWIPVHGLLTNSHATLVALPIGFAGAFAGVAARRLIASMAS